jgi:hypothetical protein
LAWQEGFLATAENLAPSEHSACNQKRLQTSSPKALSVDGGGIAVSHGNLAAFMMF